MIIMSGGQSGVDQAALDAALHNKLKITGWCPPGRSSDTGPIPEIYKLNETANDRSEDGRHIPRSQPTEWNVRDSAGTLILTRSASPVDTGTAFTILCCKTYGKPVLISDPYLHALEKDIYGWININKFEKLNVAGPAENKEPGIYEITFQMLCRVFKHFV